MNPDSLKKPVFDKDDDDYSLKVIFYGTQLKKPYNVEPYGDRTFPTPTIRENTDEDVPTTTERITSISIFT